MTSRRVWTTGLGAVIASVLLWFGGATPAQAAESDAIYSLVNQSRWDNGLAGLVRSPALDQVAAAWAEHMASTGTLEHNPDFSSQIPAGWTGAAENVAQGHPSGSAMHAGWMASAGHRTNLLGPYTDIGIAFISAGGTTWGVEVFASYPGHSGPLPPVAQVAQPEPDPQPSEIVEPSVAPTVPPVPSQTPESTPSRTSSQKRTASPEPSVQPTQSDTDAGLATGVIVFAAIAAVATLLGLLALTRRNALGTSPDADDIEPPASTPESGTASR